MTNLNQENYKSPNLEIQKVTGNNRENSCCEIEGNKIDKTYYFPPFGCWAIQKKKKGRGGGKREKNKELKKVLFLGH